MGKLQRNTLYSTIQIIWNVFPQENTSFLNHSNQMVRVSSTTWKSPFLQSSLLSNMTLRPLTYNITIPEPLRPYVGGQEIIDGHEKVGESAVGAGERD